MYYIILSPTHPHLCHSGVFKQVFKQDPCNQAEDDCFKCVQRGKNLTANSDSQTASFDPTFGGSWLRKTYEGCYWVPREQRGVLDQRHCIMAIVDADRIADRMYTYGMCYDYEIKEDIKKGQNPCNTGKGCRSCMQRGWEGKKYGGDFSGCRFTAYPFQTCEPVWKNDPPVPNTITQVSECPKTQEMHTAIMGRLQGVATQASAATNRNCFRCVVLSDFVRNHFRESAQFSE